MTIASVPDDRAERERAYAFIPAVSYTKQVRMHNGVNYRVSVEYMVYLGYEKPRTFECVANEYFWVPASRPISLKAF
jgi:hypothetical protein